MLKKDWPNIFPSTINGKTYHVVDSRRVINGHRTGKREYYETDKAAQGRAEEIRRDVINEGYQQGIMPLKVKTDAALAMEKLQPYGRTLCEAVDFYVEHLKRNGSNITISHAVEKWKETKKLLKDCGDIEKITYDTLEYRIDFFEEAFKGKMITELNSIILEPFFRDPNYSSTTRRNLKSIVSEFLQWCTHPDRKWLLHNPCDFMRIKSEDKEVEIIPIDDCRKLIEASKAVMFAKETAPYVMIGLFAGLRPSELRALRWDNIDFKTHEIRVESEQIRYVPMHMNLAAQLDPYREKGGEIIPRNWRKKMDCVKAMAGYGEGKRYPSDGLRHSFGSYWLALHNDRPRLAEIMGNSVDVIKRHYRKAIPKSEAEQFWSLI